MARSLLTPVLLVLAFLLLAASSSSVDAQQIDACTNTPGDGVPTGATIALGWGVNWNNQISKQRGDVQVQRTPTQLRISSNSAPKYTRIDTGITHTAILESNAGKVFAVGDGTYGKIGAGPSSIKDTPSFNSIPQVLDDGRPVAINNRAALDVAIGWHHTCILVVSGADPTKNNIYCAGRNNRGQLGTTSVTNSISYPTPIDSNTAIKDAKIIQIASGPDHLVALTSDGALWTWGAGTKGELGNGLQEDKKIPQQLLLRDSMSEVQCGYRYCLALTNRGDLWGWGLNDANQMGGASTSEIVTAPVKIISGVTVFSAGGSHVLAVVNGQLYSWGSGTMGQTAQAKTIAAAIQEEWTVATPQAIPSFDGVSIQSVAAGMKHSLVLDACGNVYGFGSDALGQLGLGRTLGEDDSYRSYTPRKIANIAARKLNGLKVFAGGFNSYYTGQSP